MTTKSAEAGRLMDAPRLLLGTAPRDWQAAVDRMSVDQRSGVALSAAFIAQRAAGLAAYLEARSACGGDLGHEKAAKRCAAAEIKARRVLGFTDPRAGVLHLP